MRWEPSRLLGARFELATIPSTTVIAAGRGPRKATEDRRDRGTLWGTSWESRMRQGFGYADRMLHSGASKP
jgi:hypothetical protein